MAKITTATRYSDAFGLDPSVLDTHGVLNPTLGVDTQLFIDPLLLAGSAHAEIRAARKTYEKHFETVIEFLAQTTTCDQDDVAWKSAYRLLAFPEAKWTCLGYGAGTVSGSGSGLELRLRLLDTARQIVGMGIRSPDLFAAMALFEKDFGPDRISDMTTNVIIPNLIALNHRILDTLDIKRHGMTLKLGNGKSYEALLPINPFVNTKEPTPVLLVPKDILRDLPVATDWDGVARAATENQALRSRLNDDIAGLWATRSKKDKDRVKTWATGDRTSFETLLDILKATESQPYDFNDDPKGEIFWREIANHVAQRFPKAINPSVTDEASAHVMVEAIIEQFRFLVEDQRYSAELYNEDGTPKYERSAQRLFWAVAHSYCKAYNLEGSPEAETGNGPVDFKFSGSYRNKVLVEIKLSTNPKVVAGFTKQLERYVLGTEASAAYYVIIDVGELGLKHDTVVKYRNAAVAGRRNAPKVILIDGSLRKSASKL